MGNVEGRRGVAMIKTRTREDMHESGRRWDIVVMHVALALWRQDSWCRGSPRTTAEILTSSTAWADRRGIHVASSAKAGSAGAIPRGRGGHEERGFQRVMRRLIRRLVLKRLKRKLSANACHWRRRLCVQVGLQDKWRGETTERHEKGKWGQLTSSRQPEGPLRLTRESHPSFRLGLACRVCGARTGSAARSGTLSL